MRKGLAGARASAPPMLRTGSIFPPNARFRASTALTRLNLNAQYSTGQGASGGTLLSGWKGALAKDWTFATTLVAGSGLPETPIILNRVATGTGVTGTVRADYIGGSLDPTLPGYGFNTAAFADPLPGQWGDAGRNIITGPDTAQFECVGGPGLPNLASGAASMCDSIPPTF